jgi:hypothetical protein
MFTSSRASACLVLVAFGAVAAGCGASSSGGGSSSALSKSQIDTQANAICAAESAAGEAVPTPSNVQDASQTAAYFDKVDPIIGHATTELAALKPDSSVATDWNAYIALRKQEAALIHTIRLKADAKDPSGLTQLQNSTALGEKVDTAATAVGAATCAE